VMEEVTWRVVIRCAEGEGRWDRVLPRDVVLAEWKARVMEGESMYVVLQRLL
jgi:hypothetical protein